MNFKLYNTDKKARTGLISTDHGEIETPIFMPVGTQATVKMLWQHQLEELDAQIILGNTYHLLLRPGHELIERAGGLHKFMNWKRPILTDSGGFQVFSLADLNKKSEEGVLFQSHIDGTRYMLSPEKSMEIQRALGSDIVMAFDECPALPATHDELRESMELTLRWAKRCQSVELKPHQNLFGIVQGGLELDLRLECLERLHELNLPGLAIGGLSVGEKNEEMVELLNNFVHKMPEDRPRYLMGVGKPLDILNAVRAGVDMFDCVLPTRNARNGQIFTKFGPLNIKKARFKEDHLPLEPEGGHPLLEHYSRAYIRHLYISGEFLAGQLMSFHNIWFYLQMMQEVRLAIKEGRFDDYYREFYKNFTSERWK